MKIKRIRSQVVRLPVEEPLAGGPPYFRSHNQFVTLRVETEVGIEGIGAIFFGGALAATLKHAVDQLSELLIGVKIRCASKRSRKNCAPRPRALVPAELSPSPFPASTWRFGTSRANFSVNR